MSKIKRPGYGEAIDWLARNDDCYWLGDTTPMVSVAAAMVRDLYGVFDGKLIKDLRIALAEVYPDHSALRERGTS
jgi:hypothetical protein